MDLACADQPRGRAALGWRGSPAYMPSTATSILCTKPAAFTMGNLGGRFGGARRKQFKTDEERLPELIRRHMACTLKADMLAMLG